MLNESNVIQLRMYELYTFFNKNDTLFVNFFQIDFQPFSLFLLLCSRRPRISGNPIVFPFTIKCILQSQWKVYVYNLFIEFPISCNVHGTWHNLFIIPPVRSFTCPKTAATENWYRIPIPCTKGTCIYKYYCLFFLLSPWTHNSRIESW